MRTRQLFSTKPEDQETVEDHTSNRLSYFLKLLVHAFIDHIVKQTNLQFTHHGRKNGLNKQELLGFNGVKILTWCHPIHDKPGLWSADEDISVPWVKDSVTRNGYLAILRDLHPADNMSVDSSDTDYKVRKYFIVSES